MCLKTYDSSSEYTCYKGIVYNLLYNINSKESIDKRVKDGFLIPYKMYMRDKKIEEILNS
jgi:hypothetical protein